MGFKEHVEHRTVCAGFKGAALSVLATAQLVIAPDYSIGNIALPDIGRGLHFANGKVRWVISASILTTSAGHGLTTTAEGKATCDRFD